MKKFLMAMAAFATVAASAIATSACVWAVYQPEEPEFLNEN